MSSTRPDRINPNELNIVDMEEDTPMAGAIEDRPQMIPIADAPSNGTQLANSNVQQPSSVPPARVQPANPPSALSTPAPYANIGSHTSTQFRWAHI